MMKARDLNKKESTSIGLSKTQRRYFPLLRGVSVSEGVCYEGQKNIRSLFSYATLISLIAVLFLISSCEKDFVVKEQATMKGMVINSLFTDVWPVTVYLTDSYGSAGTNNVNVISDARMELYEDGVFKEALKYVPSDTLNYSGSYISQLIPQKGKKYLLKAIHPVYGIATAEDVMPLPASIISQQLIQYPDTINHLTDAIVKFNFKDDGNTENYYRINVWIGGTRSFINPQGDTITSNYSDGLRPELLTAVSDTVRDGGWFMLFSDKSFNGQTPELQLRFPHVFPSDQFTSLTLWVELHTVSKTHYEYFRTLNLYRQTNTNSEPVNVYTNVQGGYGIFAAEDFQSMPFVIK